MNVSIMVCTWNRAAYLDQCLARMQRLRVPPGIEWEILIVNNNCTDNTDKIIFRHAQTLPIRRLFEPQPGKSYAANRAILEAKGELIICSDDDVLVSRDWVAHYAAAARDWPDAAFFGGTIDPKFEGEPPRWVQKYLVSRGPYAVLQLGDNVRPFAPGESPHGANMAIRAATLKRFSFDERLGCFGSQYLPAEDGELFARMKNNGLRGIWVGPASVQHLIGAERLTRQYVWNWYLGHGRTLVLRNGFKGEKEFLGAPRWAVRVLLQSAIQAAVLFPFQSRRWVRTYTESARMLGVIYQYRATKSAIAARSLTHDAPQSAGNSVGSDR